jgi:hypothetical protein
VDAARRPDQAPNRFANRVRILRRAPFNRKQKQGS